MSIAKGVKELQSMAWQCRLKPGSLAWLLKLVDSTTELSQLPRLGKAAPPDQDELEQLTRAKILSMPEARPDSVTSMGHEVLFALSSPVTAVTVRLWASEQSSVETCAYFPGNIVAGQGVLLNEQLDGLWQLSGMVDDAMLLAMATLMIPPSPVNWISKINFKAHLDSSTATVLCALFDLARTAFKKQGFPNVGLKPGTDFSLGEISGFLEARWGLSDFDQMITYLPASCMLGEPPSFTAIDMAVARLVENGFLNESITGRLLLCKALQKLIPALYGLRTGLQWQRLNILPEGDFAASNRIFLVGPGGMVFSFTVSVADHIFLERISGDEMALFFANEVAGMLPLQIN